MRTVGIYDAKAHLSELVSQAERGEEIVLTRNGKIVAKIVPAGAEAQKPVDRTQLFEKMAELREEIRKRNGGKGFTRGEIKAMIEEGRR